MQILFLIDNKRLDSYSNQLKLLYRILKKDDDRIQTINLKNLSEKKLNETDIVISNKLPENLIKVLNKKKNYLILY